MPPIAPKRTEGAESELAPQTSGRYVPMVDPTNNPPQISVFLLIDLL